MGRTLFVLLMISAIWTSSCQFDKVGELPDPGNGGVDTTGQGDTTVPSDCDPELIYFQRDVLPILVSSCAKSGCHDVTSRQEGIILTDYANVMQTGDIRPGNPGGSDLYEVITETDLDKRMPQPPNPQLTSEQIAIIRKWIEQGANDLTCNPGTVCDDANVTYSATVVPIFETHCYGCHNPTFISGGVVLTNYNTVASLAGSGKLMGVISHAPGFINMPQGGAKLSACNIQKIKKWVDAGAKND